MDYFESIAPRWRTERVVNLQLRFVIAGLTLRYKFKRDGATMPLNVQGVTVGNCAKKCFLLHFLTNS